MPLIDLTYPKNAVSDEVQERLTELWSVALRWEGIGLPPATNELTSWATSFFTFERRPHRDRKKVLTSS